MLDIILTTLNSKYIHSSFGLRYLYANLGDLQAQTLVKEFTIHERPLDIVEKLLDFTPAIIGFGVYIWNAVETEHCIKLLKQLQPDIIIVVGGPEVSHVPDSPNLVAMVDYVITGAGELQFRRLCQKLLSQEKPPQKVVTGIALPLELIQMPYKYYTAEDVHNRIIYVEASRGCPFKCEFCLSALDKTSKSFSTELFLAEIDLLISRGATHFKFIDRTFNLKVKTTVAILEFFLARLTKDMSIHFEVVPDRLPEKLRTILAKFPEHVLQFEIGVQTFDPDIQNLISRKQDNAKTCENLVWLRENTKAHIHADLIFGLPGDSLNNFAKSFDKLVSLNPQEIQLGILKRLRGAPINRHTLEYAMVYSKNQPYNILSTKDIDFKTMQRVTRFARFWDMIGNSGRFPHTKPVIFGSQPFANFMQLADNLYKTEDSSWKISLRRLFKLLHQQLVSILDIDAEIAFAALEQDFIHCNEKGKLSSLLSLQDKQGKPGNRNKRQKQH
ncbi:Mg-protoporphyrin IX monomethyl ester oxidative cyclase [hydrothermal vent metagenome]|uniref:Mg-protoporphyrin IX monomethyl ester oxidative cyclase n=1 Tax=hydrothermal vent metagenome TaxID=652676 RepID=A0A3B0VJ66_9ZZZZ